MGEREAEYVASVVLDRIRPRARWSDEARAAPSVELQAPTPSRRSAAVIAAIVFPAVVIVALVWLGLHSRQPRPQGVRTTTSVGVSPAHAATRRAPDRGGYPLRPRAPAADHRHGRLVTEIAPRRRSRIPRHWPTMRRRSREAHW